MFPSMEKSLSENPLTNDARRMPWWVVTAIIAFVAFFSLSAWYRQVNLYTAQFDMGNMEQVLWQTTHGRVFQFTSPIYARHESRLAVHSDFLLLILTPFYALWSDPRMLMIVQVLAVASGAIPLFRLAAAKAGRRLGGLLAVGYLLYPPLLWATTFDVHAVVFATPLLLWAWWALETKRPTMYAITIGLALLSKEEVGLAIGVLGFIILFKKKLRGIGLATIAAGFGWSILMIGWAIPAARNAPGHFAIGYFEELGDSTGKILTTVFTHPTHILRRLMSMQSLGYAAMLLGPVGWLALLGWPWLLAAAPSVGINLLSENTNLQSVFFHYTAIITPFVFLAAADSLRMLRIRFAGHGWPRYILAAWCGAWAIGMVWAWAPLPGLRFSHDALMVFTASPYRQDIAKIRSMVKPTDRLALTNNIAPQFTARDYAWSFPASLDQADGAVILLGGQHDIVAPNDVLAGVQKLKTDPTWSLVYQRGEFYYFRRVTLAGGAGSSGASADPSRSRTRLRLSGGSSLRASPI